jgi:hypothetical protein
MVSGQGEHGVPDFAPDASPPHCLTFASTANPLDDHTPFAQGERGLHGVVWVKIGSDAVVWNLVEPIDAASRKPARLGAPATAIDSNRGA